MNTIVSSNNKNLTEECRIEATKALNLLIEPGQVVEMRVPHAFYPNNRYDNTISGYYTDMNKLVADFLIFNGRVPATYITLNACHPDHIARRCNRCIYETKTGDTTTEKWIVKYNWIPFDIDPLRLTGVSSTDEMHELTIEKAKEILEWGRTQGFPDPIMGDSGNGAHLLYRINMPNTPESKRIIGNFQKNIADKFNKDDKIEVQCFNDANRIWKLYGSICCKGDNLAKYPHRISRILYVPSKIEVLI